ncbi:MAG: macro domain-containing protein [Bacteroidota bacterium]
MKFIFTALKPEIAKAWSTVFKDIEAVEIRQESIFNLSTDTLVSPANSYGYMNGGIDFSISKHLGWHIEKALQEKIRSKYYGELLVGQAEILETGHEQFTYLISAPTMRHPMTINRTPNVYLAMRAILLLAEYGRLDSGDLVKEKVKSIAMPALGTGVGQVKPMVCARQMRIAWEDVMNRKHEHIESWKEMGTNFAYFYTEDERHLKYDIP